MGLDDGTKDVAEEAVGKAKDAAKGIRGIPGPPLACETGQPWAQAGSKQIIRLLATGSRSG